jgi:hypothetical protein
MPPFNIRAARGAVAFWHIDGSLSTRK